MKQQRADYQKMDHEIGATDTTKGSNKRKEDVTTNHRMRSPSINSEDNEKWWMKRKKQGSKRAVSSKEANETREVGS
jgi:hypothetical protein